MWFLFSGVSALSEEGHLTGFHCVGFLFNLNTETKHTDFFLILPAFSTMGMMFSVGSRTLTPYVSQALVIVVFLSFLFRILHAFCSQTVRSKKGRWLSLSSA